jgi:rare lipoprotein A
MYALTAAHRTLPFNSIVLVERRDSQDKVEVRINDRGPFVETRVIDLSKGAASKIRMIRKGVVPVVITPYKIPSERNTKWIVLIGGFKSVSELNFISRTLRRDGNYVLKIRGWHGDRSKHHLQVRKINNKNSAKRLAERLRTRGYAAFLVRSK